MVLPACRGAIQPRAQQGREGRVSGHMAKRWAAQQMKIVPQILREKGCLWPICGWMPKKKAQFTQVQKAHEFT